MRNRPRDERSRVLVLGNYRPTIPLARSLAEAGYRVIVTRGCGRGTSQHSRFVAEVWNHPPLSTGEPFYAALGAFLRSRPDIGIVYPIWEACMPGLTRYRHLLPDGRAIIMPDPETTELCLDKPRMLQLATEAGVACAKYRRVETCRSLVGAANEIGFPIIVRPTSSKQPLNGKKAVIVTSRDRLRAQLPSWPTDHADLIVQRYVNGPRINLYFAARHGRPIRYLASKIDTTDVLDGTGYAVDGETIPLAEDIKRIGDRLISRLGYHGVGLIQCMRDQSSGALSFIELNPRVSGSHTVAELCGLDLGRIAVDLALGRPTPNGLTVGESGKRYVWTFGALSGIGASFRSGEIGLRRAGTDALGSLLRAFQADIHMTWRWDDPKPALALLFRKLLGRTPKNRVGSAARLDKMQLKEGR